MTYRIDTSMNDAPYQGIHIFGPDNTHVLEFGEDDAPVHDFNSLQHQRARWMVETLNSMSRIDAANLLDAFSGARPPKHHERIKL